MRETAARRRTPELAERLEEIGSLIDEASQARVSAFDLDLQFHRVLAEATGNALMVTFERAMIAVLRGLLGDGDTVAAWRSLGNIREIIDAVSAGDPKRARDAMRGHLIHSLVYYGCASPTLLAQLGSGRTVTDAAAADDPVVAARRAPAAR